MLGEVGTVRVSPMVTLFLAMLIVMSFSMMKLVPAKKSVTRPETTRAEKMRVVDPLVKYVCTSPTTFRVLFPSTWTAL